MQPEMPKSLLQVSVIDAKAHQTAVKNGRDPSDERLLDSFVLRVNKEVCHSRLFLSML